MNPSEHPLQGPSRRHASKMFDQIAGSYDLVNRILSLRRDIAWRKKMAHELPKHPELRILDLATGTGDVLLAMNQYAPNIAAGIGADLSGGMLVEGRKKLLRSGLAEKFRLVRADATRLSLAEQAFDVVTIAFGIRNVVDTDAGLREMFRVLKPGGCALILEFSLPGNPFLRIPYLFYFRHILPRLGGLVSGKPSAYRYLNQTVETFPYGQAFCDRMAGAGFTAINYFPLTFGIATLYKGYRPDGE